MTTGTKKALVFGCIGALAFTLFFAATCISYYTKGTWDAQIATAFVSAPTSLVLIKTLHPVLEYLGELGSPRRQIGEWAVLWVAGGLQYFFAGVVVAWATTSKD